MGNQRTPLSARCHFRLTSPPCSAGSRSRFGRTSCSGDKQNEGWLRKQEQQQQQAYAWKPRPSPGLTQDNGRPLPCKPHPTSHGSGLMGNHGYMPYTSPPFLFFSRERDWHAREKKEGVSIGTRLSLSYRCLWDQFVFIKPAITMQALVPPALCSSWLSWRRMNWAQPKLLLNGFLFHHGVWPQSRCFTLCSQDIF